MIKKESFGMSSVGETTLYTISNQKGMEIKVSDYGATLVSILVPDRDGNLCDVVLGFDSAKDYEDHIDRYFGAIVGRVANRIKGGSFELNGTTYQLTVNNGENTLHGGRDFYSSRKWIAMREDNDQSITFSLFSPDGDQGFPGNLDVGVTYELTEENEVKITYHAVPDQDTLINLTNHSYFNLEGHASGSVLDQKVWIDADAFTRADSASIPTGEILDVTDTPMDFRREKTLGQDIEVDYEALNDGCGYDHNYVLNNHGEYQKAARMRSDETGIQMEVYTDLPGMQLYSANFIDGTVAGKGGIHYIRRSAVCFETQYYPDAVHKENFEGPVCVAEDAFHSTTTYKFGNF